MAEETETRLSALAERIADLRWGPENMDLSLKDRVENTLELLADLVDILREAT